MAAGIGMVRLSVAENLMLRDFRGLPFGRRGWLRPASLLGASAVTVPLLLPWRLELHVAIFGLPFSSYTVQILPYLLAVVVLAAFGRPARMPAALGQPLAASLP